MGSKKKTASQSPKSLKSVPLAHNRTRYRPQNAYWMATMAKLAYIKRKDGSPDGDKILERLNKLGDGFEDIAEFNANSSEAVLIRHRDYIVAAFRGTDELADWWDNINARPMDGPFGSVHVGFQKAMMDVWPAMRAKLREFRKNAGVNAPLWLTGHSLGGAMATLAAAQLIEADEAFFGVYTFGQPRCGDRAFARVFNMEAKSRFFRFQNNNDIVTRVPGRVMGYSHVGSFIYISADGELSFDAGWWYQFLDGVKGAVDDLGDIGLDAVDDHGMGNYLAAIEKWGNRPPED